MVSEVERTLLAQDAPGERVEVLSNLHRPAPPGPGPEARRDLLFVGGFRHPPNVDAVRWFVGEVFPRLRAARPDLRFHCIGDDVPDAVARLATQPGVVIHGHVADLQPWLDGCRVSVAPLRYGAGVKGKVNQALALGQGHGDPGWIVEVWHRVEEFDFRVLFQHFFKVVQVDPVVFQRNFMVDWFVIVKSSQGADIAWCFNGHFVACPQEKLGHQVDPLLAASRQQDVVSVSLDSLLPCPVCQPWGCCGPE